MPKAAKSNPYKIQPLGNGNTVQALPKGHQLFPQKNSSMVLFAPTKSGKTTVIGHILKHCTDKRTKIFFFVPTKDLDPSYKEIFKYLDSKHIEYDTYHSFIDDKKVNILDGIIEGMLDLSGKSDAGRPDLNQIVPFYQADVFSPKYTEDGRPLEELAARPENQAKQKKPINVPEYVFVFDDLGSLMKNPSIYQLLLKQRHFGKTIISVQDIKNIAPNALNQIDYLLVLGKHSDERIEHLRKSLDLPVDADDFQQMYAHATADKYNFLYVDKRGATFKKNFDQVLARPS